MEKKFKHKITGEIITYKDGVIKSGTFVLDMGCEPSSEYWEEVKKKLILLELKLEIALVKFMKRKKTDGFVQEY